MKYLSVAFALGLAWCVALMVPEVTRTVILADRPLSNALLVCLISVALAAGFRRPIAASRKGWRFVALALTLPFAGAALWLLLASFLSSITTPNEVPFWEQALVSVILLPYSLGIVAFAAYYVIIPMGFLSQYVMLRLSEAERQR